MILHSIAMRDSLFPQEYPETCFIFRGGCRLEGISEKGQFRISRVISTNPADYLRYSPGQMLPEQQQNEKS